MLLPPSIPIPDTLKGIDDLIRADFEAFRALWFVRLLAATFLVVVGLVMEGPELWHEILSIIHRWNFRRRFHFSIPETHTPEGAKLLAFIGWILIVAGVAGEFVADSFVSKADGFVQKFDEILLADAQKKTGAASERAAMAFERAAQTEREASQENERAAKAEQQAAEENSRAAKALEAAETARKSAEGFQLQIAQANERAAKAELETERLRKQLADRTLTDEQVLSIGNKLKLFKGQPYTVTAYWDSPESLGLANRINAVLKIVAEWSYSDEGSKSMLLGGTVGIFVWTHPDADESTKRAAEALIEALNTEGLEASPRVQNPQNNPKHNKIALVVGAKR